MDAARLAWGRGLATVTLPEILGAGESVTLEAWFPKPHLASPPPPHGWEPPDSLVGLAARDEARGVETMPIMTVIDLDTPPADVPDAYLRLHLLSHRLVEPGTINLAGLYDRLQTVVWTAVGPCAPTNFEATRARLRAKFGYAPNVRAVDRFPRMVDYVVPDGVRLADADRVRLGAYLARGTTVLHEGFVNIDSGSVGAAIIDGRLASGVVVHDGAHIGGGAATTGPDRIEIGARTHLGALAGTGISLGADCVVEPGLYLTANSRVSLVGVASREGTARVVRAAELAGVDALMFRRNGAVLEARTRASVGPTR